MAGSSAGSSTTASELRRGTFNSKARPSPSKISNPYSVICTLHSVLRNPYSVLRNPYSVIRHPYSVLCTP
ncbi:hypothetical protein EBR16_01970 [bacterium]|nr:hypothetical protein [bacterium]